MTRYLLDTTALIDFSKGFAPATRRILKSLERGDELGVCAVNVAEFYAGIQPGTNSAIDDFIEALTFWPTSRAAAARAGYWRYGFARKGQVLSTADTLVAATAHSVRAIVLTDNERHYPMPEVETVSVRA